MVTDRDTPSSPRIIVIGGGMAGLLASIKLSNAGFDNHVVYEKGESFGGTWRENTYPGLTCDVPAHIYCYSFEQNPDWNSTYATRQEIYDYFDRVARKYGVYDHTCFGEEVVHCEFRNNEWHIRTAKGTTDSATFVIAATGVLHHPKIPDIAGIDSFRGDLFHSARWNHELDLTNKRVGLIGTGSTATNLTCALAGKVKRLDLFQRSPQWIMPIENVPFSESEKAELREDPQKLNALRDDAINNFANWFSNAVIDADSEAMQEIEAACKANLEDKVQDPDLREKLRPDYRPGCKRLVFSEFFYDAIQHEDSNLVTTGIKAIEPEGIRLQDGALRELDVIVMCTGFQVDSFIRPTVVKGPGGLDLDSAWADKPTAYLAVAVPRFPNFFMLNGPGGPVGNISLVTVSEAQMDYVLQLMEKTLDAGFDTVCVADETVQEYEAERRDAALQSIWATGCNSWYLDKDGVPTTWPWSPQRFEQEMSQPKFELFEFHS